jgi:hypothetical protein
MIISVRRAALALSTTAALYATAAAAPVAAQADIADSQCPVATTTQPFAPWGDSSSYELVPRGDFETPGWTLSRGAGLVSGSEPFDATGSPGSHSVTLPAGGSAQSPVFCIDASFRTLRLFVAGSGAALVQVVYQDRAFPVGVVVAGGDWAPSRVLSLGSHPLGGLLLPSAQVSLRLTAIVGDPQIDDVFIDPWNRG